MARIGTRATRLVAWTLLGGLLASLGGGCGTSGGGRRGSRGLEGEQLAQARRLYAQLQRESSLQRDRKALDLAGNLLDYYPLFARNDEVLGMAVEAAQRLGDTGRALDLTDEMLAEHPDSPLVESALQRGAALAAAAADTARAADYLIRYHDLDPVRGLRADGTPRAAVYLETLEPETLDHLLGEHPATSLRSYILYLQLDALLSRGDTDAADRVLARIESEVAEDRWTEAAAELAGGMRPSAGQARRYSGPVRIDQVGVLCPLTGRFAVLGNAFYEAALLATDEANREHGSAYTLVVEDTAGDPVAAALAARRLCGELGSMAILGAMMSDPTAAAALVTDAYGVPLVSPTATNDRIWELGKAVFQTNLTGLYEVRLLAQLASRVLLKKDYGLLYPDDPQGRRHAEVFRDEILGLGGRVVAEAAFDPQGTDFRAPILELRARRPEVLFVPASVDQMIMLGPQLDFYHMGSLVMGLSPWNSEKLAERSDTVLERAIFPDDFPLFPPRWSAEFDAGWDDEVYPREATALALKAYQATRMLLDTMAASAAGSRSELSAALVHRLANQDFQAEGPLSFGPTVRMFLDQRIVPFPADRYDESWLLTEGASIDSLGTAAADSLVGEVRDVRPD